MRAHRIVPLAGVAAGLAGLIAAGVAVVATTTTSEAERPVRTGTTTPVPLAVAAGDSGGPVVYPGLVSVHFDRLIAAIGDASTKADTNDVIGASTSLQVANAQLQASWVATRYLIKTTPPPVVGEDRAGAGGAPPAGPSYGGPPDVALQFFDLQHDFASAAAGLLGSRTTLNAALLAGLKSNAQLRSQAVEWIYKNQPPAPPAEDRAGAGGAAVAATLDAVMPLVVNYVADEVTAYKGTIKINKKVLPADVVSALKSLVKTANATQKKIDTYWPPLPADD